MMLNIKDVSLRSLCVALRWCRIYRRNVFPAELDLWEQSHTDMLQKVCEEYDKRHAKTCNSPTIQLRKTNAED